MANKELEIVIKAKDEASATIKSMTASIKSFSKGMVAVGGAVTGALALAVNAAGDAEVAMGKVSAILDTMGKNTPTVNKEIQKLADATLQLGFDNEDAALSITKLYQRTGDLTKAHKLNNLAMDLARFKNISLDQATDAVGKALMGNTRVLRDLGVEIDDTLTPMQNLEKAQKLVAGQSDKFAKSLKGQMQVLKATTGEITESIGGALLPVITSLLQQLTPIINSFVQWTQENPKLFEGIVKVVAILGGLSIVLGTIGLILPTIATGFAILFSPITAITLAVTALIAAFVYLYKNWSDLQIAGTMIWDGFKIMFANWVEYVVGIFNTFKETIKGIWNGIQDVFKTAIDNITDFFKPLTEAIDKIKDKIDRAFEKAQQLFGFGDDGGRATGGGVQTGGSYIVGEKGPELFTPASNGSITPNYALQGGGGNTVIVNMNGGTYLDEGVAEMIGDKIIQNFKKIVRF